MLQYKVSTRKMAIGPNKGKTVYYAQAIPQNKITTEMVEQRLVHMTSLSVGDIRNAITSLAQVVREEMYSGRAVDLADLGTFKVVSNSKMVATEKEVTVSLLRKPRIQFFPKQEMRKEALRVNREVLRPLPLGQLTPIQPKASQPAGTTASGTTISGSPSSGSTANSSASGGNSEESDHLGV